MALWSRFFTYTAGSAASRAASAVIGPVFGPAAQNAAARRPYAVLSPEAAAQAEAQGLDETHHIRVYDGAGNLVNEVNVPASDVDYPDDSLRASLGPDRYRDVREMTQSVPTVVDGLALWRRRRIDQETFDYILARNSIRRAFWPALRALRFVLPSVTDMVRFGVREVYNPTLRKELDLDAEFPDAFGDDAANIGLSRETAKNYWAAHWELPSFTQGAQMLFRGEITRPQFRNLLKALDFAPTWRDKLESIARQIPTMPDFIRFAVREVYSPEVRQRFGQDDDYPAVFTEKAALHGLAEEDAKAYWAAHWELPSVTQGFQMFHRDVIDRPTLRLLLRAKDVMPFWRDKLEQIAYLVPGRIDLRRMYATNVITREQVKRGYLDLGYNDVWAERLTDFAVKLAEASAASGASHENAYVTKARNQLWATTHAAYLAGDMTDAVAIEKLPDAGVAASAVPDVLSVWRSEREVQRMRLSKTEIKKAWKKGVMNEGTGLPWTREDAYAELRSRGMGSVDANTFLDE